MEDGEWEPDPKEVNCIGNVCQHYFAFSDNIQFIMKDVGTPTGVSDIETGRSNLIFKSYNTFNFRIMVCTGGLVCTN